MYQSCFEVLTESEKNEVHHVDYRWAKSLERAAWSLILVLMKKHHWISGMTFPLGSGWNLELGEEEIDDDAKQFEFMVARFVVRFASCWANEIENEHGGTPPVDPFQEDELQAGPNPWMDFLISTSYDPGIEDELCTIAGEYVESDLGTQELLSRVELWTISVINKQWDFIKKIALVLLTKSDDLDGERVVAIIKCLYEEALVARVEETASEEFLERLKDDFYNC